MVQENTEANFGSMLNLDLVKGDLNLLCADMEADNVQDLFFAWLDKKNGKFRWRSYGDLFKVIGVVDCALGQMRVKILMEMERKGRESANKPPDEE